MTTLEKTTDTMAQARRAMIDSQLRTSGVNAPFVLERMRAVAREEFVPEASRPIAYMDRSIPLGAGAALPAPLVQGMILQEAAPEGSEIAIVVTNGCDYLAELVRPLVAEVITLSAEEAVAASKARKKANLLLIDGAVEHLPKSLLGRLADNARIITGMAEGGVTRLAIGRKSGGEAALLPVQDIGIPRIAAFDKPKSWSF